MLGLLKSCIYYAHQTHEIYHVVSYSVDFKALGELWNPLSIQYFINVVLFGIKDLQTFEMTKKPKSNLYVGAVNIFPKFWHCHFDGLVPSAEHNIPKLMPPTGISLGKRPANERCRYNSHDSQIPIGIAASGSRDW